MGAARTAEVDKQLRLFVVLIFVLRNFAEACTVQEETEDAKLLRWVRVYTREAGGNQAEAARQHATSESDLGALKGRIRNALTRDRNGVAPIPVEKQKKRKSLIDWRLSPTRPCNCFASVNISRIGSVRMSSFGKLSLMDSSAEGAAAAAAAAMRHCLAAALETSKCRFSPKTATTMSPSCRSFRLLLDSTRTFLAQDFFWLKICQLSSI
jgi:hypothetical protein